LASICEFTTPNERRYKPAEEIANAATHGLGALLSIAALVLLVRAAAAGSDGLGVLGYALFGASLILLFGASATYHGVASPRAKKRLEVLDHASIYALIAGTYSSFCLTVLRGPLGWTLFAVVWALAVAGAALKVAFINKFRLLSTLGYVAMGWLIVFAFAPLRAALPPASLNLLFAGGVAYTVGAAFYALKKVPWFHPLWHLFVLAGAACHVLSALLSMG